MAQPKEMDVREPRKSPRNPLGSSLVSTLKRLAGQQWELPYLANLATSLALLITIILLIVLYPTIGLAMQLTQAFLQLIKETFQEMKPRPAVEKLGHGVAISVYALCLSLLGLIALPCFLAAYFMDWIGVKIKTA